MSKTLSIKHALAVWREAFTTSRSIALDIHPDPLLIQKLAFGIQVPDRDRWYEHLVDCPRCNAHWIDFMQQKQWVRPVVELKVAGTAKPLKGERKIEYEQFVLTFRENLQQENSCLIILEIKDNRVDWEGRLAVVKDGKRKPLMAGEIVNRKLSAFYDQVDCIDWNDIIVEF